jgi:hypothetical protein
VSNDCLLIFSSYEKCLFFWKVSFKQCARNEGIATFGPDFVIQSLFM